jgi:site-specific DNA-methyltransferase (adenine-specific)
MYELHCGDGVEMLRALGPASVDAIVTDPPYCSGSVSEASRSAAKGQGLRSETLQKLGWFVGDNMGTAGLVFLLRAMAWEAQRVLKPSGSLLVFCDWRMLPNLAPAIESTGLRYQNLIVWDKGAMGLGTGFRAQHELVLHFTAGAPEYHDKGTANVLGSKRVGRHERQHQTQKPVELLQALIEVVCPPGGLVVDPFAGSGSTGVAALRCGRSFIGAEREAAHVATAETRLQAEMACDLL